VPSGKFDAIQRPQPWHRGPIPASLASVAVTVYAPREEYSRSNLPENLACGFLLASGIRSQTWKNGRPGIVQHSKVFFCRCFCFRVIQILAAFAVACLSNAMADTLGSRTVMRITGQIELLEVAS